MLKRNQKRLRGVPVDWDELKVKRNFMLTQTAWEKLTQKAADLKISRSEVIERVLRGMVSFIDRD